MNTEHSTTEEPAAFGSGSMQILDEAAQTLRALYGEQLGSLFVERLVIGIHFVGVRLSCGHAGVAYTPGELVRRSGNRILRSRTPTVRGMPVAVIIDGMLSHPFASVIRLATLNALSARYFANGRYRIDDSGDVSGVPALFNGRRICMVGAIMPLLKRLKEIDVREVSIIDYKKETQAEAEACYGTFVSPERTAETLALCDTAVFTGASVANGTIEQLIAQVPDQAVFAVVGPTAGFVPEPLFRRNAVLVSTVVVTQADQALDILAEGGGGYRLFGSCVRKINLLNVPRLKALGLGHF